MEKLIKVKRNSGNSFIEYFEHGQQLRSYDTVVVKNFNGHISLASCWDATASTRRQVCYYLGLSTSEIRERIKSGEYTVFEQLFLKFELGVKYNSKGERIKGNYEL